MKKRHHHYVWRNYLRAWAPDEYIWCCRKGEIFRPNLMGVGQKRDFYKLKKLTPTDISYIRKIAVDPSRGKLKEANEEWINIFNSVDNFRDYFEKNGIHHPDVEKALEEVEHNLEENYHAKIEANAICHIDSILREDISFYDSDDGCMHFAYYICMQYMRTNKIQESIVRNFANFNQFNIENSWPVMRHIFTTNMAWSFFAERERFKMVLIKNNTDIPFITGDQPVINTYAQEKLGHDIIKEIELYYPVSPKLAILISEKEHFKNETKFCAYEQEVERYNKAICKSSHEQIYADSEETISLYINCANNA